MKKLLQGIVKFRREILPDYRETFARLALGQSPDALYIGCSDSRVAVNVFASTDPGDLFVIRNVGNMVPPFDQNTSEAAAVEFALQNLKVSNIIVCGHSECGAMQALAYGQEKSEETKTPHLHSWLCHGKDALKMLETIPSSMINLERHNQLSQLNVLMQLEHLKTYPVVQERIKAGTLTLHGWWFELSRADVYAYSESSNKFVIMDENEVARILEQLEL